MRPRECRIFTATKTCSPREGAQFEWPEFDERSGAAICYTSGTTGNPKGAMFSHRSMVLNAMMICAPGLLSVSPEEAILPIVPMFHINGWCIPYAALIGGAKLVLPGPRLDGAGLYELMETEGVTVSAGVPTVWLGLLQHIELHSLRFSTLRRVVSGGSAVPRHLIATFSDRYGIDVRQGWGMTETVAVATLSALDPAADGAAARGKARDFGQAGEIGIRRRDQGRR